MQKRKLLLSLVALCSIVGMGITSCNNESVQGPQGEQGPVGPQGPAGENGENGEDGSLILHGEGKPADSLGKDTDVYIDSKTGDLYQKENGSWTLVMNIKGEDGEDGKDGHNGSNGAQGKPGETAYSSTILPSTNGFVTVDKGSAIANGKDTITFTIDPNDGYYLSSFSLNGTPIETNDSKLDFNETSKTYTYETTMVKNGFVVSATFDNKTSTETTYIDGKPYLGTLKDPYGYIFNEGTQDSSKPSFSGGSNTEDDPLIVSTSKLSLQPRLMFSSSTGKYFKLNGDYSLEVLNSRNEALPCDKVIDLGGHTLTITNKPELTRLFISQGSKVTFKNGKIVSEDKVLPPEEGGAENPEVKHASFISMGKSDDESYTGGELTLEKVELEVPSAAIAINSKDSTVNIINSTIKAGSTAIGTNATLDEKVTNVNINIDHSNIITDGRLNETKDSMAMLVNVNANVNIKNNSYIEGTKQSLIVRGGNVTISDSTIAHSHTYSGNEFYENGNWGSGNAVPYSAIVVGDTSETLYNYDATLTLNNVKFLDSGKEVEGRTYRQIYVYDDGTHKATLNIDEASYATFDPSKIYVREDSELSVINRN